MQSDVSLGSKTKYDGDDGMDLSRPAQPIFIDDDKSINSNAGIPKSAGATINLSGSSSVTNTNNTVPTRPRKVDNVLPNQISDAQVQQIDISSSAISESAKIEEEINSKENAMNQEISAEVVITENATSDNKEISITTNANNYNVEPNYSATINEQTMEIETGDKVIEQPENGITHDTEDELSLEEEMVSGDEENTNEVKGDLEQQDDEEKYNEFVDDLTNKLGLAAKRIDISGFKVAPPVSASSVLASMNTGKNIDSSDWALSCTKQPISMRKFTGVELKNLQNASTGRRNKQNAATERLGILYEHDTNPNKPGTVEDWTKTISARDEQDIFFAVYDASFHNANHIPYTCDDVKCGHTFISEHIPTDRMWKFDNEEDEAEFLAIRELGPSSNMGPIGRKQPVPISDKFAVAAKDASLWDLNFMYRLVGPEFVQKYQDTVDVIGYIDEMYTINLEAGTISPINYTKKGTKEADLATNIKNRIIVYNRIIKQLSPDEYGALLSVTRNNTDGRKIKYVIPECTCPKCGKVISEKPLDGGEYGTIEGQLFTRRPLAIIANISPN